MALVKIAGTDDVTGHVMHNQFDSKKFRDLPWDPGVDWEGKNTDF